MKKALLSFGIAILVLFAVVTLLRKPAAEENAPVEESTNRAEEKERIVRFWEIYREATEHRIAGRLEEAAESYRGALALQQDHEDALYYFANVSFELDRFAEAERSLQRLIRINPSSARAHSRLGDLYLSFDQPAFFDIDKAEAEYRNALAINKEETGPTLRLGQVALIRGDLTEANNLFDAVLGSNYRSVGAYFLKGYIAWKTGKDPQAEKFLAKASEYSGPVKPVHGVLGEGDTKTKPAFERHALFHAHTFDLFEITERSLPEQARRRYQNLDRFLESVRSKSVIAKP